MQKWTKSLITQIELGQRIRKARERVGMSQRDFSDAVKKDQTAISEYETGKRKVAAVELSLFASVLQLPVSYFYEGDIEPDNLEQILIHEFRQITSREAQNTIITIVHELAVLFKKEATP